MTDTERRVFLAGRVEPFGRGGAVVCLTETWPSNMSSRDLLAEGNSRQMIMSGAIWGADGR